MRTVENSGLKLIKGGAVKCYDFEYLYADYQDESLPEPLMSEMKCHHEHCQDCQEYAEDIEYLIRQAREIIKVRPLPADTKERIYSRLNQKFDLNLA